MDEDYKIDGQTPVDSALKDAIKGYYGQTRDINTMQIDSFVLRIVEPQVFVFIRRPLSRYLTMASFFLAAVLGFVSGMQDGAERLQQDVIVSEGVAYMYMVLNGDIIL